MLVACAEIVFDGDVEAPDAVTLQESKGTLSTVAPMCSGMHIAHFIGKFQCRIGSTEMTKNRWLKMCVIFLDSGILRNASVPPPIALIALHIISYLRLCEALCR